MLLTAEIRLNFNFVKILQVFKQNNEDRLSTFF